MVNEFRADPVYSVGHVNEYVRDQDSHHGGHPPSSYPQNQPLPVEHTVSDVTSILGLPEEIVTPEVLRRVTGLLAELDRLRWLDQRHRSRQTYLEGLADHDPVVAGVNRRGFMRKLEALLTTGGGDGILVVLHINGIEHIRQVHGLAAGDDSLRSIHAHLVEGLRTTDLVGLLGNSDFGILLPGTGLGAARDKVRQVMERINDQPFQWQGQSFCFAMFSGYHILVTGEDAETALAAADGARRGINGNRTEAAGG